MWNEGRIQGRNGVNMGLKKLIARRVLLAVPTAIGVVTVIFAALSAMTPIMRVAYFVGQSPRDFRPENIARILHEYGLDQPIFVQYLNWLGNVFTLNFGRSLSNGQPAMSVVFASLPVTLELILYSAPWILWFGVWLGTKATLNKDKKLDHAARIIGTVGVSFPVYILAGVLMMVSVSQFRFDPLGRLSYSVSNNLILKMRAGTYTPYTNMITIDALLNGDLAVFLDAVKHLILPVGVFVFTQSAALMKVTRSGLIEASGKPYIVSAMTKGLSRKEAIYKHGRKNALISVLTLSGLLLGNMLMGLALIETLFNIPGFAYLVAYSARTLDTPVVFAAATFAAMVYVLINLTIDILYGYVDPRIKLL